MISHRSLCLSAFIFLFLFRYVRVVVNMYYSRKYRPTPVPDSPTYHALDLTAILCTRASDLLAPVFLESVQSILASDIAALLISTGGDAPPDIKAEFLQRFPDQRIKLFWCQYRNRREQTALAVPYVKTKLLMLVDDHTPFLNTPHFLPTLLAPFEDPKMGAVIPGIVVRNHHHFRKGQQTLKNFWLGLWNVMGCLWLERWYLEYKATSAFEGSISCMSSRCVVVRSEIFCDPRFQHHYRNEYVKAIFPTVTRHGLVWEKVGPLHPSDDACLTRHLACKGWKIKVQAGRDSTLTTELGVFAKFMEQCGRWNRSKFQSCPNVLYHEYAGHRRYPYLIYTDAIYPYFRISLLYEGVMLWLAREVLQEWGFGEWFWPMAFLVLNFFFTTMKFLKVVGHFQKHGYGDLIYFPLYIMFAWANTPWKFWWMWTRADDSWGSAKGDVKTS